MNKKVLVAAMICSCMVLAACQKKEEPAAASSAPAAEPTTEITSEVSGEMETENYDEETGEVLEEFEIESEINTVQDTLTLNLSSNASTGYHWQYLIGDEDVLEMVGETYVENENADAALGAGGRTYLSFRAKQEGSSALNLFYLAPDAELDIPEGDAPEDYSDLSMVVNVTTRKDGMLIVSVE